MTGNWHDLANWNWAAWVLFTIFFDLAQLLAASLLFAAAAFAYRRFVEYSTKISSNGGAAERVDRGKSAT